VTDIARDMATRYGMVEDLGYVAWEPPPPRFLDVPLHPHGAGAAGAGTQQRIDDAVRGIVMGAFDRTTELLQRNATVLERCARELLAQETLDEPTLRRLTQDLAPA
jgi:cell division protease FtsH